jgi:hypothetical protein
MSATAARPVSASERVRHQKVAVALMLTFLVGYFAIVIGVQFGQGVRHGYGTGFSNNGHVPTQVLRRAHLPAGTPAKIVAERTDKVSGGGLFHDGWRLALWAVFVVGITSFWMFIVRGVPTI